MSTVNFQQRIIEELNVFFEPIIDINGNEDDIVDFFNEFGYNIRTPNGASISEARKVLVLCSQD